MMTNLRKRKLRTRMGLFFVLMFAGSVAIILLSAAFGTLYPDAGPTLPMVLSIILLAAFLTWVWTLFDQNLATPIQAVANHLQARAQHDSAVPPDPQTTRYLGDLAPAVEEIGRSLSQARNSMAESVAHETTRMSSELDKLIQTFSVLPLGVVVCSGRHTVTFYNGAATVLLNEGESAMALGRSVFEFTEYGPLLEAYNLAVASHSPDRSATFLMENARTGQFIMGEVRLLYAPSSVDAQPPYVLVLRDASFETRNAIAAGTLLADLFVTLRPELAALEANLALREQSPSLAADITVSEALLTRTHKLVAQVNGMDAAYRKTREAYWPIEDIAPTKFIRAIRSRLDGVTLIAEGHEQFRLNIALSPMASLVAHLARLIAKQHNARALSLIIREEDGMMVIGLGWSGQQLYYDRLAECLAAPLPDRRTVLTGRSVLRLHGTDCWPEEDGAGRFILKIPLPHTIGQHPTKLATGVNYDFELLRRPPPTELIKSKLSEMTYTVFDTETTGLMPSQGDEICQIAALRIVNGRVVPNEVMEQLVNPGRPIPLQTTNLHGITDDMVAQRPTIDVVGRQFHAFAKESVLVAHNAPFDMEFLRRHEADIGKSFDQPVIDTVLMSAFLFGRGEKHSLDAICERLGVRIPEGARHTAMGDTIATAEAFQKMLTMAEARGIETFGQLIAEFRKHERLQKDLNTDLVRS